MYLHSVAPKDLIQADYEVLKSYEHLETTREIEDLLFIQSLEGRAHNGSGVFNKRTYVNTTIEDVVTSLERDPREVQAKRQAIIDDIVAEQAGTDLDSDKLAGMVYVLVEGAIVASQNYHASWPIDAHTSV